MLLLPTSLLLLAVPGAQEGLPPAELPTYEGMDPEVAAHLQEHVAQVEAAPADGERHAELGLAYEANTCFEPAVESYRNAVELLPDAPEWRYRLGVMLMAVGKVEEAEAQLSQAAGKLKNTPVIQARLGAARLQLGDVEGAEAAWETAIAGEAEQPGEPVFPQSRAGLASVRFAQERYEEAVSLCEEALEVYPGYRHAHYLLAMSLFELGQDERAERELARGLEAWPEYPPDPHQPRLDQHARGYHHRMMTAENRMMAGQVQEAVTLLQESLSKRPEDPQALNLLARCQQRMGQQELALETLRRSEAVDGELVDTKIQIAIALLNRMQGVSDQEEQQELLTEAQEKARAAVELAPMQGRAHFTLGMALLVGGDGQGAYNEMSLALRLGCEEPQLYTRLAQLSYAMGRSADMIRFAERNVREQPDDLGARQLLVEAYFINGDLDAAEEALASLESYQNPDPQVSAQVQGFVEQVKARIAQQREAEKASQGPPAEDDGTDDDQDQ